jgi:VanZ like family
MAVAALTLQPASMTAEQLARIPSACVICGTRGSADAILNLLMFMPLGLALGHSRRPLLRAAAVGLAISMVIEMCQMVVPGRHSSAADLLWNSAGATAGAAFLMALQRLTRGSVGWGGPWTGGFLAAALLSAGILLAPGPTRDDYFGQWTPDLGRMPQYDGSIVQARFNGEPFPPGGLMQQPPPHRDLLKGDWSLDGLLSIGSPTAAVSPILSIYDGHQREVLLLGVHGDDLVFRESTLATLLRFDTPDVRIFGAFGSLARGDTVGISVYRAGGTTCLGLSTLRRCGLGVTPGRTWGLLLYLEGPTESARIALDVLWLVALFFPIGLFGSTVGRVAAGGMIASLGGAIAVFATPLILGPWYQALACCAGLVLGRLSYCGLARQGEARSVT